MTEDNKDKKDTNSDEYYAECVDYLIKNMKTS
jgi:hypothetical protein